jgi:hypothetical protein
MNDVSTFIEAWTDAERDSDAVTTDRLPDRRLRRHRPARVRAGQICLAATPDHRWPAL